MKALTKAEEQVMKYLWEMGTGYLKDIVAQYPDPAPAYTTVSTVVNVLVKKEFIGFETHGKSKEYRPLVSKESYAKESIQGMVHTFFNDSPKQFASFFTQESQLSVDELKELQGMIAAEIKKQESND
ncbi:MAG: penicillinase repressor [Flammeovirgaceae bacterium]|nr:penicillinase repressor [Flammeovirgaceae bacterium]MBR08860.1 penicillinase repressor [Rickettsiales bacterium]HCX21731.1 penicillinase repressor [Cytophagales bacterium]|tara:strand:+ start:146 stop:526 length:381 start_codon:yes stop_codon:yes gene_type:complete